MFFALARTSLFYHSRFDLSRTFFKFFQIFSTALDFVPPSRTASIYYHMPNYLSSTKLKVFSFIFQGIAADFTLQLAETDPAVLGSFIVGAIPCGRPRCNGCCAAAPNRCRGEHYSSGGRMFRIRRKPMRIRTACRRTANGRPYIYLQDKKEPDFRLTLYVAITYLPG